MTKYHVTVQTLNTKTGQPMHGQRVSVEVENREDAAAEAIKTMIRGAKAYNAKYSAQGLPEWAWKADTADAYRVEKVRKAPARRVNA